MTEYHLMSSTAEKTEEIGKSLGERVKFWPEWGKLIFLSGEMGSGKTTFARGFFRGLGVPEPAQSPTFSFFREYDFPEGKATHVDLYRFRDGNTTQSPELLGAQLQELAERGDVLLIEWADEPSVRVENVLSGNAVGLRLEIPGGERSSPRSVGVTFRNDGSISETETKALMEEFMTPFHVRRHIFAVTSVAVTLATELLSAGVFLDPDLVKNGALCHDLVRYVDFRDFDDHSRYEEEVTPQKLELWKKVKEKYRTTHHAEAISDILRDRGFYATAKVTEAHHTSQIFRQEPFSWEEKVVYYADKRVLHDRIVSLEERFEDGRKRYAHEANPHLEEKVFALEKELFAPLPLAPQDIS